MTVKEMEKAIYGRKKITLRTMKDLECYIQNFVVSDFYGKISYMKIYNKQSNTTTEVLLEII